MSYREDQFHIKQIHSIDNQIIFDDKKFHIQSQRVPILFTVKPLQTNLLDFCVEKV